MAIAGGLERGMEVGGVVERLGCFEPHRRQIAAAAEPALGGDQHPRVEMRRRHARAAHVRDQADAAGPEPRVLSAPGIWARNSGLNSPQTVETLTPTFSNTRPRITLIAPPPPPGRGHSVRAKRPAGIASGRRVLNRFELGAEPVAQRLEPRLRRGFQRVMWRHGVPACCSRTTLPAPSRAIQVLCQDRDPLGVECRSYCIAERIQQRSRPCCSWGSIGSPLRPLQRSSR